jgi:hypothetical protein
MKIRKKQGEKKEEEEKEKRRRRRRGRRKRTFQSILLKVFPLNTSVYFGSFRNILREFPYIFFTKKLSTWTSNVLSMHYFAFSFFF